MRFPELTTKSTKMISRSRNAQKGEKFTRKKSLSRCALEAYMLNMSYGNYVAQGLDKEEVDIEL